MSEHICNCKYIGCHINDCIRWCHFLNREVPYEFCNEYCPAYVEIYDEDLENASDYYANTTLVGSIFVKKNAFKAGAKWREQQLKNKVFNSPNNKEVI